MTLKEAKKILKKEGFIVDKIGKPRTVFDFFIENESPDICEAMQVVSTAGYDIYMEANRFEERKERLKKENEENTKDPDSSENHIKEDSVVNPAIEESASQFNDSLLDEQGKKIAELTDENERLKDQVAVLYECKENNEKYNLKQIKRLGKEITRLNKTIHKKNMKIEEFRKESYRHLRGKIKVFYENVDLEQMLKDKDAVLSDVAEELRLSKIREKNLTEVCQKYMKENEELKKKLDKKIVDKIDAKALKSAESALAYKEKVIAEKDDVIADLGKELNATKKELEEKTNLVEMVRKGSKEYREYGIAALSMIRKMAKVIVNGGPVSSKDYKEYRRLANGYSFNPHLPDFSEEEEKKPSLFRDDSVGAVTNQKDFSPAKGTHPTEDNPDEVELDEILECVRKALEEGHTVSIKYDEADEGGDHYVTWESNI